MLSKANRAGMEPQPDHSLVYMTLGKLAHLSKFRKITGSILTSHVGKEKEECIFLCIVIRNPPLFWIKWKQWIEAPSGEKKMPLYKAQYCPICSHIVILINRLIGDALIGKWLFLSHHKTHGPCLFKIMFDSFRVFPLILIFKNVMLKNGFCQEPHFSMPP